MGRSATYTLFLLGIGLLLNCKQARNRNDSEYLVTVVMPVVSAFAERHGIQNVVNAPTNRVTWLKISHHPNRQFVSTSLRIDGIHRFYLSHEGEHPPNLWSYERLPQSWIVYSDNFTPEQRKVFEGTPNKLTAVRARELMEGHFHREGHVTTNFYPVVFHQMNVSYDDPATPSFPLPYYEARWFRRDVNVDQYLDGFIMQPHVQMVLSGINEELLYYARFHMPVEGGDWGLGSPRPAHPISTSNIYSRPAKVW